MANKSYNQYCGIAHALDQIGERWTLIIVRNLLMGPKRFSDLMKGLPGISTNILTDRLNSLVENHLVETRFLPPPAASTVYELTEEGIALRDVLMALAHWGSHKLGEPHENQFVVAESIEFMIQGVFLNSTYRPVEPMTCNLHITDQNYEHFYTAKLSALGMALTDGGYTEADVRLETGLAALSDLSSGQESLKGLVTDHKIRLEGTQSAIESLLDWVDNRILDGK